MNEEKMKMNSDRERIREKRKFEINRLALFVDKYVYIQTPNKPRKLYIKWCEKLGFNQNIITKIFFICFLRFIHNDFHFPFA